VASASGRSSGSGVSPLSRGAADAFGEVGWGYDRALMLSLLEDEASGFDVDAIGRETEQRIATWNGLGRELCGAFLEVAERVATPV